MDALVQAEEQAEEEEVFETVEVTSGQTDAPGSGGSGESG